MWQQDMVLIEERRKQLEREAAHSRFVRDLQRQQSNHRDNEPAKPSVNLLSLVSSILRGQPDNRRLKAKKA